MRFRRRAGRRRWLQGHRRLRRFARKETVGPPASRRNIGALTHKIIGQLVVRSESQLRVQVRTREALVICLLVDERRTKPKALVRVDPRFLMRETVSMARVR